MAVWKIENDKGENITVGTDADALSMVRLMIEVNQTTDVEVVTVTKVNEVTVARPRK